MNAVIETNNIDTNNIDTNINENNEYKEEEEKDGCDDATTYRYEFTKAFCEILEDFAKLHKYDDRHLFKDSWTLWADDNKEWIERECELLYNAGYTGDALDKMFKSARYYFRKKSVVAKEITVRKTYTKVDECLLKKMDAYIKEHLDAKPHDSYVRFCDAFRQELGEYMRDLGEDKFKKTFKNRCSIVKKLLSMSK